MFEGKEFETKIGEYGRASVDVTPEMKLRIEVAVEVDLVAEAKRLAKATNTPIDDTAIMWLESITAMARAGKAA
jgi:hypothetical protein